MTENILAALPPVPGSVDNVGETLEISPLRVGELPAFAKAIDAWRFTASEDNLVWTGNIAGPDRLRFLGMISRYTALISDLSLTEAAN